VSDTSFSIRTATAIVENGSLNIQTSDAERGAFYEAVDGRRYSKYGVGLAFLFVPYAAFSKLLSSLINVPNDLMLLFLLSFYNVIFGAGTCVVTFLIARYFNASKIVSVSLALILAFATMCWRYSVWDFSEAAQMFFLTVTIYLVIKNTYKSIFFSSLAIFLSCFIKIANIVFIPVFFFYILFNNCKGNRAYLKKPALFLIFPLLFSASILYLNFIRFGNPLETGYGLETSAFYLTGAVRHAGNLLFSMDKGIFIYNPILLLAVFGYIKFLKSYRREAILFLCIILITLAISASFYGWEGGWCWGPRFLVPTLPLWLVPLFFLFSKKKIFLIVLSFLVILSFLIQVISVLQKTQEYHSIKYSLVSEDIRGKMPADILGSFIILKHKIFQKDNVYNLREFGINSNEWIDTGKFETFPGLNLWYCHLARFYDKPAIKYIPLLFLPFLFMLFIKLSKTCGEI
jgi:hypothetical protein